MPGNDHNFNSLANEKCECNTYLVASIAHLTSCASLYWIVKQNSPRPRPLITLVTTIQMSHYDWPDYSYRNQRNGAQTSQLPEPYCQSTLKTPRSKILTWKSFMENLLKNCIYFSHKLLFLLVTSLSRVQLQPHVSELSTLENSIVPRPKFALKCRPLNSLEQFDWLPPIHIPQYVGPLFCQLPIFIHPILLLVCSLLIFTL